MMQQSHDTAPPDRLMQLVADVLQFDPSPRGAAVCLVAIAGAMAQYLSSNERVAIAMALRDAADEMDSAPDTLALRRRRFAAYVTLRKRRSARMQLH